MAPLDQSWRLIEEKSVPERRGLHVDNWVMSEAEQQLIEKYWHRVGGTLIEEFPAVRAGEDHGRRNIDAVIIKTEEKKRLEPYSAVPLQGEDVIVVQCKTGRLGMYLMGQAYFSMHLIERHEPASIQAVALCGANDSVLGPIFEFYPNCEVVVIGENE